MVEFWTKKSVWVNLTSGATFHFSSSAKIEFGKSQIRFLFFTNLSCLSHKSLGFSRPHFDLEMGSDALARAFVNPWLAAVYELHMGEGKVTHFSIELTLPLSINWHLCDLDNIPNLKS